MTEPFVYPTNDFDRTGQLMGMVGSFWENVFDQRGFIHDTVFAKGQLEQQTVQQLCELFDGVSRFKLPVFHKERWYALTLLESERNAGESALIRYGGTDLVPGATEVFYDGAAAPKYGVPQSSIVSFSRETEFVVWDAPEDLTDVKVITNRITDASLTLTKDVDFRLAQGGIVFREDPFLNDLVIKRDVIVENKVVDREVRLWLFHSLFDLQYVFEQFGYVLQLALDSSQGYKDIVNAAFDALTEGTHARSIQNSFEAMTGTKLVVNEEETVEAIRSETILQEVPRILVITDKTVYQFNRTANILVSVGDTVVEGQALADTLQIFEFNRGQCPTEAECPAVALGRGFLGRGFFSDLVFENKAVPLVVETDVEGFTKVSWKLGGFPGDVELFFDQLHERGVAEGETLANLMDTRTNKVGEPGPTNLPATINPFEFLCENVLRNHVYMVKVQTESFGPGAVGMNAGKLLRKIHPPQTAIIIVVQLDQADDPIIMDGPGTDEAPGFEEEVSVYLGLTESEAIGPSLIKETVRVKLISGRCV